MVCEFSKALDLTNSFSFCSGYSRAISNECISTCVLPFTISSAHSLAHPGPSLTQTASHNQNPLTSGLSPISDPASVVTDNSPLNELLSSQPSSFNIGVVSKAFSKGSAISSKSRYRIESEPIVFSGLPISSGSTRRGSLSS